MIPKHRLILRALALMAAGFAMRSTPALAQTIELKDGKTVAAKALRRDGETIMATVEVPITPGQPPRTGELGYPLSQIARLEFPEPPQFRTVPDLIAQGKGSDALTQLEPVIKYYQGFHDAPGSWWPQAAMMKAQALASVRNLQEADALYDSLTHIKGYPDISRAAQVQLAFRLVPASAPKAMEISADALKESKDQSTLAAAYVLKGDCLLVDKKWEEALLSFLQVPVFYPGQKLQMPSSLLGQGRAFFGMENFADAHAALNELLTNFAGAPEAVDAKAELEKITRREKALADPQSTKEKAKN